MRWSGSRRANGASLPHYGGLDGLRAVAVAAVILFHGGVSWAPGGFLGVEVFFVLSGFLITSLLVTEWARSATIGLRRFWGRRARRLLPALFALVVVIGAYYAVAGPTKAVPGLKGSGISTLLYFNNWHQIADRTNYFAASGPVSPLQHTWSLAIEEQFYLVWPLLVLAVLSLTRRSGASERRSLQILLALSIAGVIASATEMAILFDSGHGPRPRLRGNRHARREPAARRIAGDRGGDPAPLAGSGHEAGSDPGASPDARRLGARRPDRRRSRGVASRMDRGPGFTPTVCWRSTSPSSA